MEIDNPRIRLPMTRIIESMFLDRTLLLKTYKTEMDSKRINAENLSDLAGNHLFDESPELFGITKDEGLIVRKYLSGGGFENYSWVEELHRAYPQMDVERPEFSEKVNRVRLQQGLPAISL